MRVPPRPGKPQFLQRLRFAIIAFVDDCYIERRLQQLSSEESKSGYRAGMTAAYEVVAEMLRRSVDEVFERDEIIDTLRVIKFYRDLDLIGASPDPEDRLRDPSYPGATE